MIITAKIKENLEHGNSARSSVFRYIRNHQVTTSDKIQLALGMDSQNVRNAIFDLKKLGIITKDAHPRKYGFIRYVGLIDICAPIVMPPYFKYIEFNPIDFEKHWFSKPRPPKLGTIKTT